MSRRGESGQTLVEMLVVAAVSVTILLATLATFDVFGSGTASTNRLNVAQDADRRQLDGMTRVLRDARPRAGQTDAVLVPASGSGVVNDLAVTTFAGAGTPNLLHVDRFCVNATTRTLWREVLDDASAYAAPGAACPSSAPGWTRAALVDGVANTSVAPLFSVDATRRAVDIDLRVDGRSATRPLELRSSAYLRLPTLSSTAASPVAVGQSCNGTVATLTVTGTSASATFTTTLSNGAKVTLGTGTSVSFPAATSMVVTPVVTSATGVLQTLAARAVLCP